MWLAYVRLNSKRLLNEAIIFCWNLFILPGYLYSFQHSLIYLININYSYLIKLIHIIWLLFRSGYSPRQRLFSVFARELLLEDRSVDYQTTLLLNISTIRAKPADRSRIRMELAGIPYSIYNNINMFSIVYCLHKWAVIIIWLWWGRGVT